MGRHGGPLGRHGAIVDTAPCVRSFRIRDTRYPVGMTGRSGTMLLQARKAGGLTQAELARRSGVSRSTISLYETGAREPGADLFLHLLGATGAAVTVERFSSEQVRRGRIFSDLVAFAHELPHRWPGDRIGFPAAVWHQR